MSERSPWSVLSRKRRALFAVIAALVVALALVMRHYAQLPTTALIEGLAFTGAGLGAWAGRPDNRLGPLMVFYTPLVWSFHLTNTSVPLLWTASSPLFLTSQAILIYAIVTFPKGRVTTVVERTIFWLSVVNVVWQTAIFRFIDPALMGCPGCNLALIHPEPGFARDAALYVNPWLVTAFMVPTGILLVVRWLRASRPARRVLGPILLPALAVVIANRVGGMTQVFLAYAGHGGPGEPVPPIVSVMANVEEYAVIVLPVTFLVGLVRERMRHTRVSRLVVELGGVPAPAQLEAALARALGDPLLKIGVWDEHSRRYLRDNGEELGVSVDSSLVMTRLERSGRPLALMVHDPALLDEPGLVEATTAAARLAVENERLQADLQEQLEEVQASRQRIVEAQDEERRRLERNLHDGAQQRLLSIAMALDVARSALPGEPDPALHTSLEVAAEELRTSLKELRQLASGLHPTVVSRHGLAAALRSLAETARLPVTIAQTPDSRLDPTVETAAYFVVSEALANVAKHASASEATVSARVVAGRLELAVSDDGLGGASAGLGSGLRGLADRVEALGGELRLESPAGAGTRLIATIPLDVSEALRR